MVEHGSSACDHRSSAPSSTLLFCFAGVTVIGPHDVRAALGGALSLLPLIDETIAHGGSGGGQANDGDTGVDDDVVARAENGGVGDGAGAEARNGVVLASVVHLLTALLRGSPIYAIEVERVGAIPMIGCLLSRCPPHLASERRALEPQASSEHALA